MFVGTFEKKKIISKSFHVDVFLLYCSLIAQVGL